MILFREDWDKYPSAIVDTKTTNKSFVRLAGLLKAMGIKNHAFPLALINPNLQGINPRDPDLDKETMIAIAVESAQNPWYFFREVFKLSPPAGVIPITFKANRANIAAIWLAMNHITSYLIQPRQTGKSSTGDGLETHVSNVVAFNTELSVLTKDEKLRTRNSRRLKEVMELLPNYIKTLDKRDVKNNERITIKARGNVINFYLGQKDKKAADNVGRGMTTPIVHIDEFAYIYNIDIILPVMLAAASTAREVAREQGSPYFTLFTTTPGKLGTPEGRFAYDVYKNSLRWSEEFYDLKNQQELEDVVKRNTRKYRVVLLEFNHRQLGYTDEWLRERIMESFSSGENAESDYLNVWVGGNTDSPIDKKFIPIIQKSKMTKYFPETYDYGYVLKWWINEREKLSFKNKPIVIGLDTSDALGGKSDDIGLVIRDPETGAVIATGKYNEINLGLFAKFLVDILERYPKAILIPERKSSAMAIIDNMFMFMLKLNMNPFKRIFNWVVSSEKMLADPKIRQEIEKPNLTILAKYKSKFGFATSGSGETSRSLLYGNIFRQALTFTADKIRDPDLIEQLLSLRVIKNRIDHEAGGHDDLVIAWLLTYWFLVRAKNKKYYKIDERYVLRQITDTLLVEKNPDKNKSYILKQQKLKEQIDALIKELHNVRDEILALRLVNKIHFLYSKLDTSIVRNFNIETMLEEIKLYKKIKKLLRR